MIISRRICWPNPDATCLEGGCLHCDGHTFRAMSTIRRYAAGAGAVPNRCGGRTQDARAALADGECHDFYGGVEVRLSDPRGTPDSPGSSRPETENEEH